MQEERNVKWVLGISVIMLLTSTFFGAVLFQPYYYMYPSREPDILDVVMFFVNRIDILFFLATIATATLSTTGFGKKELMYKASIYLFIISMTLFFVSVLKYLFTFPWTR